MDEDSLMRKILAGELHYAKLWLVCVALRGVSWDKMPFEQRELAFQAKDAAFNCLSIFLTSSAYRYVSIVHVRLLILKRNIGLHSVMLYTTASSRLLSPVSSY
jgi:CBS-domain-containing membrane protein